MPELKPVPEEMKSQATHDPAPARAPRWIAWVALLYAAVLIVLGILAGAVANEFHQYRVETKAQMTALSNEIAALRHVMTSETDEDIIYLKAIALRPDIDTGLARTIARSVHEHAQKFKRDPDFVLAMIEVESNFEPEAVSSVGALGLLQVMPQWQEQLAISCSLKDPDCNIRYGLQIYAFYSQMYQDTEVALSAYNRGPGAVDWDLMRDLDPTRNGYGRDVIKIYERLKAMSVREH